MTLLALTLTPALAQSLAAPGIDDQDYALREQTDESSGELQLRSISTSRDDSIDDLTTYDYIPQIDWGAVTVKSDVFPFDTVARIWASTVAPDQWQPGGVNRMEHWFLGDPTFLDDPSRGFRLEMEDPSIKSKDAARDWLDANDGNWENKPYVPVYFFYTAAPDAELGGLLVGGAPVDRYSFELVQNEVQVGAMLREVHLTAWGAVDHIEEHWLLFEDFEVLRHEGDTLTVTNDTFQFVTTLGFLAYYDDEPLLAYANPVYELGQPGSAF